MLRRYPTRIEVSSEDANELDSAPSRKNNQKETSFNSSLPFISDSPNTNSSLHSRIGYISPPPNNRNNTSSETNTSFLNDSLF